MNTPLYTTRVTALECFRNWLHNQTEKNASWNTEEKLLATLKGEYTGSDKADYGTLCHAVIEAPKLNCKTLSNGKWGYAMDKIELSAEQLKPVLKFASEHPLMKREICLAKLYQVRDAKLFVTGTTDAIEGCHLRDTKFKFSAIDVSEYMNSVQWRFYLDMLGLKRFWYDLFPVTGFEKAEDCAKSVIGECESMLCTAYPDMRQDINSLLNEFMDYIDFRKLHNCLIVTEEKYKKIIAGNPDLREYFIKPQLV